jgi:hypothetical protein
VLRLKSKERQGGRDLLSSRRKLWASRAAAREEAALGSRHELVKLSRLTRSERIMLLAGGVKRMIGRSHLENPEAVIWTL